MKFGTGDRLERLDIVKALLFSWKGLKEFK